MKILLVSILLFLAPALGFACEAGFCVKSTVPADAATDVPIDSKIYVYFDTTPGFAEPQAGLALVEVESQQGVLASVEVFEGNNPYSEVSNKVAVIEPLTTLSPNMEYQVVFGEGSVCGDANFSFTTGAAAAAEPIFAGATALTAQCRRAPMEFNSCDDDSAYPRVGFSIEAEAAENVAGYRVYRSGFDGVALVPELPARAELLPGDVRPEECFVVKAVGLQGTEIGDAEVCVTTDAVCDDSTEEDMGVSDMGVSDMGVSDMGTTDMGFADMATMDAGSSDMGDDLASDIGADMGTTVLGGDEGCGCRSGGSGGSEGFGPWLLIAIGAFLYRRRNSAT